MSTFNLADIIGDVSVPESGTEKIEYLMLDQLQADANNFYQLSDIDALADNIATIGLQQPIRVRREGNAYTIISGHRRAEAMRKLVAEGDARFARVPCIVEDGTESDALKKLKLIYANAATRRMTSSETAEQVKQVEALLYQLSEEGFAFPGRMVNHVAEACKVSKTRIGNLKVIERNLTPSAAALWKTNKISEDAALALAHLPGADQNLILLSPKVKDGLYRSQIDSYAEAFKKLKGLKCTERDGKDCTHSEVKRRKITSSDSWNAGDCARCCKGCPKRQTCKACCPLLVEQVEQEFAEMKRKRDEEAFAKLEEDRRKAGAVDAIWNRFKTACDNAGLNAADVAGITNASSRDFFLEKFGKPKGAYEALPFQSYGIYLSDAEALCRCADMLGCTVDYLLCRTDTPDVKSE